MPRVARRKDTLAATRKIYRTDDTAIAGVCSGIAEGLDMDPAAVRILAALLVLATFGLFTLVYATLWLVLPKHVAISPETLPCDAYAADGSPRPCFSETIPLVALASWLVACGHVDWHRSACGDYGVFPHDYCAEGRVVAVFAYRRLPHGRSSHDHALSQHGAPAPFLVRLMLIVLRADAFGRLGWGGWF